MEDSKIISLFLKRNEKAIDAVDAKYHGLCFKIAMNILFNYEDSEECVSDTWFSTWNLIPPNIPKYLSAFLSKITRGKAIDIIKNNTAQKRIPKHLCNVIDEVEQLSILCKDFSDEIVDSEVLLNIIEQFLDDLTVKDRDIFLQRYWFIVPIKKIAEKHHMNENAIKQSLFRNRKKLLKLLEKEGFYG